MHEKFRAAQRLKEKPDRLHKPHIRRAIGFAMVFLALTAFITMLCFVGAMEHGYISILRGMIGGIAMLILWVAFFYASSLCLYDYEP